MAGLVTHRLGCFNSAAGPFSPSDLASLRGWYDASLLAGADGSTISTFPDQSGNGYDGTCGASHPLVRAGASGINSLKVAAYESSGTSGAFTISSSLLNGESAASVFVVFSRAADPPGVGIGGALFDGFHNDTGGASSSHHPYEDGVIYEHFGTSARKTVGNPTPSLTSPRIYSAHSAASDFRAYLDGNSLFSTGTNTVQTGTGTNTKKIGRSRSETNTIRGKIAEVIFFNSALTTDERQKVEGYLAHKWGLTGNLDAGHPYKSVAP